MDLYERSAEPLGRVAGYAGFGAVVGTVLAAIHRDLHPDRDIAYGEWAAYSAGLAGVFSVCIEISRAV